MKNPLHARLLPVVLMLSTVLPGCHRPTEVEAPAEAAATDIRTQQVSAPFAAPIIYRSGQDGGLNTILESLGGGAGVFDLEQDGLPDLMFAGGGRISATEISGAGNHLLRFRSASGKFHDITAEAVDERKPVYSHGVEVTDIDNDGFDDLVLSGYGGLTVLHNNGDGTFTQPTALAELDTDQWSTSVAAADFNGDGLTDLYVCHYVNWSLQNNPVCYGRGNKPDVCPPRAFEPVTDAVYLNDEHGGFRQDAEFQAAVGGKGLGVAATDLDADGDVDIYVANDTTENFLYRNDGGTRLEEIGFASGAALDDSANANGSMGVTVCDADSDGAADLFVANYEDEVFALYRNLGNLSFIHASDRSGISSLGSLFVGFGIVGSDVDLDGDEDFVVSNGHVIHIPENAPLRQQPLLLQNDAGRLTRVSDGNNPFFDQPQMGRGLAKLDFNKDGKEDLLFCNSDEPAALVENTSRTSGRGLYFRLIGVTSARRSAGARVDVFLQDGRMLFRSLTGGSSYLSQSNGVVHFGIPENAEISHLTVHWPYGKQSTMRPCDCEGQLTGQGTWTVVQPTDNREAARTYLLPR
ncbi:MAG: CRTAC1 family protein [Planctomycetaceae bacterium]|nr:CRTAC1 family protein [Planctomycetaceae bacterium]